METHKAMSERIAIGAVFRKLVVVGISSVESRRGRIIMYRLRCECGGYTRLSAKRLNGKQVSCGCSRGGKKGQAQPEKRREDFEFTADHIEQIRQLWDEGYNQAAIRQMMGVPYNALQKQVAKMGLRREAAKVSKGMPPGVRFEDMPAHVLAREVRGRVPLPQPRYSLTGCAAAMACQ